MKLFKILSVLLEYPEPELIEHLAEIKAWVNETKEIDRKERTLFQTFFQAITEQPLIEWQATYVKTFDMVAEHSLHLTHHLFGEDKNRGPALIDLGELYKDHGIQLSEESKELPDYLPAILEFASYVGGKEATVFLADAHKIYSVLYDNLKKSDSPYANLIAIIVGRASLTRMKAA